MMMRPPPRRTSSGANTRSTLAVPLRLTSIWSCQSRSSISRIGLNAWIPAFAKTMSTPPHSLSMLSAADLTAPMSRWSAMMDSQRPPAS
jgi:hypothetical protein